VRTVGIVLPGIPGAVTVDDIDSIDHGVPEVILVDPTGYGAGPLSELTITRITINAPGYQPYVADGVHVPQHGNFQIRVGVPKDPARPDDVVLPALTPVVPPSTVPTLIQNGRDFVDPHGTRICYPGIDGFLDYRFWLDGNGILDSLLEESKSLKSTVRRIWLAGDGSDNQVLDLWPSREGERFYDQLAPFVQYENSRGQIPLLTVNVNMKTVMPIQRDRITNWQRIDQALAGKGLTYLLSGGNEHSQNGFDPWGDISLPLSPFWSRGSDVQDRRTDPRGATACEFHPVRGTERTQMDAVASPFNLWENGCGMLWMDEGLPFAEQTIEGKECADPQVAFNLGTIYGLYWAVAICHNRSSQRGQLMPPTTRACAEAFFKGVRG
jgi:hypothetical protein